MKNFVFIFLVLCFCAFRVMAQTATDFSAKAANKKLDVIEQQLAKGKADAHDMAQFLKDINLLQTEVNQAKVYYNDKLQNVQKRITALGDAPKDGVKEAEEIAANRKSFIAEEDENKAKLAQIELINTKIEEINNLILKRRNQTLLDRILVRQTSIFQIKEFGRSIWSFLLFIYDIAKSPYSWYQNLDNEKQQIVRDNAGFVVSIFGFVLAAAFWLSYIVRRRFGYRDCTESPTYVQKIRSAVAMAFSFGVIPAAAIGVFLVWLNDTDIIKSGNLGRLLYLSALYLLAFFLIWAAVRVIFVPKCGAWRIVDMEDKKARKVSYAIIYSAAFILAAQLLLQFAIDTGAQEDIIYSLRILAILAKAFSIIVITRRIFYRPMTDDDTPADNVDTFNDGAKISLALTIFTVSAVAVSLFGYVRLSEYALDRFLYSVAAVAIFWISEKLIKYFVRQVLHFKFWVSAFHLNPRFLVKLEFWFSIMLKPVIWAAAVIAVLGIWGFSVDIMLHDIKNFLLGFDIGGMHVSIVSILMGIAAFLISMFVFKSLKRSVQVGQLSKMDMAEDSRNSLAAGIGLIGFIVSLMLSFAVMGGSLSSIALVAGALSFGVGLGMQNIVSNFVSGIIIIFERPIKIGDWVIINGQEGIVKTINMRSTLLESFNKSDIIIPNSNILSGTLINMTYSNRIGRVDIKLAVNFSSNVKQVQETLVNIAEATPGVLSNPAPSVAFSDISGNQLIFQLNCYTANVYNRQSIANMIREKIISEFAQNGIVLPGAPK